MKKIIIILTLAISIFTLSACEDVTEPDPEPRTFTSSIENGDTITQYVGADSIDLEGVEVLDHEGDNITASVTYEGTYDLNTVGVYDVTLVFTDDTDETYTVWITLDIEPETCEINPDLEGCPVPVTDFALAAESDAVDTVLIDGWIRVYFDITPANADNQTVFLTTSNPEVATVNEYGYIFGKSAGTVTVTFTTEDGNFTVSKEYTVRAPNCEEDPYQDVCVYAFLDDDSRITTVANPNQSGTDYSLQYPNNRIYYEIFVRKFADSDGNNVGDFEGIIDVIPYLKQLNVGGLWLMPINETTSDHGYDISDYYAVNPDYGTMADFEALIAAADTADIDIIMDLVINHMGAHNAIFQDVLQHGTSSDYYDWFTWIDTTDSRADDTGSWGQTIWYNPTNRTWLKDGYYTVHSSLDNKMYFGYFSDWMPDLNLQNPEVVTYIYDVAEFWLNKGVHGFRMDATSHLYALHENPAISDRNAANIAFLSAFQDHIESVSPDAFVVIEAWEPFSVYAPYYASELSVFNFQGSYWIKDAANGYLNNHIGDALSSLYNTIDNYDVDFIDSIFLSNHDMDRVSIVTDDPEETRLAAEILLTQKSNPFIYFGDEIGIRGMRTNMRWGTYYDSMTVSSIDVGVTPMSTQLEDPNSLLSKYIDLTTVRSDSLALSYGDFIPYDDIFLEGYFRVFENGNDKELVVVLFNFSGSTTYPIPDVFGAYDILYQTNESNLGGLSPNSTIILRLPYDDYIALTE